MDDDCGFQPEEEIEAPRGDALAGTYKPRPPPVIDQPELSDSSVSRSYRPRRVSSRRHHTRGNRVNVGTYEEEEEDFYDEPSEMEMEHDVPEHEQDLAVGPPRYNFHLVTNLP